MIPYYNSHDCSARVSAQINWDREFSAKLWAEIIRQKIYNQAHVLNLLSKSEAMEMLLEYAEEIEPGDITNREGHAAKVYFNALFGSSFSRNNICYENAALNYGYGVLLSAVNREIVANGYLTQLGIFHSNVYNPFNLSCDLMEPYRPVFDLAILGLPPSPSGELDHQTKVAIIETLNRTVKVIETHYTLLHSLSFYVRSVLDALDMRNLSCVRFINNEF